MLGTAPTLIPVRHISFASRNYARAARQLRTTARQCGVETFVYTPDHPVVTRLSTTYPAIMSIGKGAGNWLWKPSIILDALERSEEGTIVLYTDSAMHMTADPLPLLRLALERPVVLFEHTQAAQRDGELICFPQRQWTKRDCFVVLNADEPEAWNMQQVMAAVQLYRNSPEARAFMTEVIEACTDPRVLTDQPNVMGLPNFPDFIQHRHDQSVLTLIGRRHRTPHFPDPTQWGPSAPRGAIVNGGDGVERPRVDYHNVFLHHRKSDHGVLTRLRGRLFGIETGNWEDSVVPLESVHAPRRPFLRVA